MHLLVKSGLILMVFGIPFAASQEKDRDYAWYAHEVMRTSQKKIEKELKLVCKGSGTGMPYNVRELKLSFISYEEGTIEKARELEVKATEIFLNEINSYEAIRPFLDVYPFTPDRARITISFWNKKRGGYGRGAIAFVLQAKNCITYCAEDSEPDPLRDFVRRAL